MIIKKASIELSAQNQFSRHQQQIETLHIPKVTQPNREELDTPVIKKNHSESVLSTPKQAINADDSLKLQLVKMLVKKITGKSFELFNAENIRQADPTNTIISDQIDSRPNQHRLVYQRINRLNELETSNFKAVGQVETSSGKSIDFNMQLKMHRSFTMESLLPRSNDAKRKKDPLVINFENKAAELSSSVFSFDIDSDGTEDQLARLKASSGLLVLDKNQDGKISNGTELFGAMTGNGFQELKAYDEDDNNFIDEADSVYQRLQIWQHHENGSSQLYSLAEKNIGAIFLGHVSTPFQLKNGINQSLGEISDSSFYLQQNGEVGSIQQINFMV